jgi:hypothetical protein
VWISGFTLNVNFQRFPGTKDVWNKRYREKWCAYFIPGPYSDADWLSQHPTTLKLVLIVFSYLSLGAPKSFPYRVSDYDFVCISHLSRSCNMPRPSIPLHLIIIIIFCECMSINSEGLLCAIFYSLILLPLPYAQVVSLPVCSQTASIVSLL